MTDSFDRTPEAIEKRTYWCFISYRHSDNKELGRQWATWLHQAIETYEVPADLVGQKNERGEIIPERIFPVFRDEEELPVDADLASPIYRALDNSRYLLAICSPRAVESTYVASEIRYFKQLGREDYVLAAIIDGEPNAFWDAGKQSHGFRPDQECFPEPLRHRIDPTGKSMDQTEPIAADFRLNDGTQGWTSPEAYRQALRRSGRLDARAISAEVEDYRKKCELMKLKILAGILGVALGTLTKRDAAYQLVLARKRARGLRRWLAAVGVLMVLALAGGVVAVIQRNAATLAKENAQKQQVRAEAGEKKAKQSRDQAEDILTFLLFDLKNQLTPIGKLSIMDGVQKKVSEYYENLGVDDKDADQLYRRNVALDNEGALRLDQGKLPEALAVFEQALASRRQLLRGNPSDKNARQDVATSLTYVGNVYKTQNRLAEALAAFDEALALRRELVKDHPAVPDFQSALAESLIDVGNSFTDETRDPLPLYEESLALRRQLALADPSNDNWQGGLCESLDRMAVFHGTRGKIAEAIAFHEENLAIKRKMLQTDPSDTRWQEMLGFSLNRLGALHLEQKKLPAALTVLEEALGVFRRITQGDPSNSSNLTQLERSLTNLSAVYRLQGKFVEEKALHSEGNEVIRTLAKLDPANSFWQMNFARRLMMQGLIHQSQREFVEALALYEESAQVSRRMMKIHPSDTGWRFQLASGLNLTAGACQSLKKFPEALAAAGESAVLLRQLVKSDSSDKELEKELRSSIGSVGAAYKAMNKLMEARDAFRESVALARRRASDNPSDALEQKALGDSLFKLGDACLSETKDEHANGEEAVRVFEESLILRRDSLNREPSDMLCAIQFKEALLKLGDAYQACRRFTDALGRFQECLAFAREQSAKSKGWGRTLIVASNRIGSVYQAMNDPDKAIETFAGTVKLSYYLVQEDSSDIQSLRYFLTSLSGISQAYLQTGKSAQALPYLQEKKKIVMSLLEKEGKLPDLESELEWLNTKIPYIESNLPPVKK